MIVSWRSRIGIDPMGRMALAGPWHTIHHGDTHAPHQGGHLPPANGVPLVPSQIAQHPCSRKRILQMPLIDPAHQGQCRLGDRPRLIVGRRPGQLQSPALSHHR